MDWPVTILFYGNAVDENTVYRLLNSRDVWNCATTASNLAGGDTYLGASAKDMMVLINEVPTWDGTRGFKFYDVFPDSDKNARWDVHIRIYDAGWVPPSNPGPPSPSPTPLGGRAIMASNPQSSINGPNYGYHAVATTHVEEHEHHDENAHDPELAADYIADVLECAGYLVLRDHFSINNEMIGCHVSVESALAQGFADESCFIGNYRVRNNYNEEKLLLFTFL